MFQSTIIKPSLRHMRPKLQTLFSRPILLWLLLWFAVSLLYLPAWKGGFQQDFHGWLQLYTDQPFWDILNRKFAKNQSFYQLTQLQLYGWTWLFGIRPLPWFLLFTALHALNGTLIFRFSSRLFQDFQLPNAAWIALAGSLLFLFNPSMTEAVLSKAAYHYLIGIQIVLWILIWVHHFLHTQEKRWVFYTGVLFLLATLTLETWYTIPALVFLMVIAYRRGGLISARRTTQALTRFFLPMLFIFGVYLLCYHAYYGQWIAHGAYHFSADQNFLSIVGRAWSYEFHLLFAGRFFPNTTRQWVYQHLAASQIGAFLIIFSVALFTIYAYVRFPKSSPRFRLFALLFGWAICALIIVLHFLPEPLMLVNNDRHLYFTAVFQFMMVAIIVRALLSSKPKIWMGIMALLLILYSSLTAYTIWQWRQSTKVFWGIQSNFHWQDSPVVLLLNLPSTYNGIGIITANIPDDFSEHLRIFHHQPNHQNIYDVSGYNMQHPWDGAHVTVLDSTHVKVTLNQWGSWWLFHGLGAVSFENDLFAVNMTDQGHEYILTLKQRPKGMVLLYQQGTQWRKLDMKKVGVEQWSGN
ncbi:MAG: hypothetical protein ABI378_15160 [Chitinophagaceae bacterium]